MSRCLCIVIDAKGKRHRCDNPATGMRQAVPVCDEHGEPQKEAS